MVDALSGALRALRLRGTTYFRAELAAPWGMDIRSGAFANFHLVVAGECYVQLEGEEAVRMSPGQLVLLPYGDAHALADNPSAPREPAESLLPTLTRTGRLGEGEPATTLICGHFDLDRDSRHPLLTGLPRMIHISGENERQPADNWLQTASALTAAEARRQGPGSDAIVDRLAEALLIQVLRRWVDQREHEPGFLAAAIDPGLGCALAAVHADPAREWTVAEMARCAGMSRTVFAQRFHDAVGLSAGAYLTSWRLLQARRRLEESEDPLERIAEEVGYADAFSLSRAFKREYGVGPASWRRARKAG